MEQSPWEASHSVKKFSAFYGIRNFITVFTTAHYWSISCGRWIHSTPSDPIFLDFILMLFWHLRLGLPICLHAWPILFSSIHVIVSYNVTFQKQSCYAYCDPFNDVQRPFRSFVDDTHLSKLQNVTCLVALHDVMFALTWNITYSKVEGSKKSHWRCRKWTQSLDIRSN
jgi:hypothetical protein